MATDREGRDDWRGDFASMSERQREAWLQATPSERREWLEEALAFAHRMGALPKREKEKG